MSRKVLITFVLALASLAFGCDSEDDPLGPGDDGPDDTVLIDQLEPRGLAQCTAACVALTGICLEAGDDIILDRNILQACRRDCRAGVYSADVLECLVATDCSENPYDCLVL